MGPANQPLRACVHRAQRRCDWGRLSRKITHSKCACLWARGEVSHACACWGRLTLHLGVFWRSSTLAAMTVQSSRGIATSDHTQRPCLAIKGATAATPRCWASQYSHTVLWFVLYSQVGGVDALSKERAVSCGADRTARLWKIRDESHLVFRASKTSNVMDCVKMVRHR